MSAWKVVNADLSLGYPNCWGVSHSWLVACLLACLRSQQHASVSQGRICTDNFTCCHTEIEAADQTFYLTQSQYTDTGPTSSRADPITPGAWQGRHWSANFLSHWYDSTPKKSRGKRDSNPGSSALEADALTTRPVRRSPTAGWTFRLVQSSMIICSIVCRLAAWLTCLRPPPWLSGQLRAFPDQVMPGELSIGALGYPARHLLLWDLC